MRTGPQWWRSSVVGAVLVGLLVSGCSGAEADSAAGETGPAGPPHTGAPAGASAAPAGSGEMPDACELLTVDAIIDIAVEYDSVDTDLEVRLEDEYPTDFAEGGTAGNCVYTYDAANWERTIMLTRYSDEAEWSWLVELRTTLNCYNLAEDSWLDDCEPPAAEGLGDDAFRTNWVGLREVSMETAVLAGDVIFEVNVIPSLATRQFDMVDDVARAVVAGLSE